MTATTSRIAPALPWNRLESKFAFGVGSPGT